MNCKFVCMPWEMDLRETGFEIVDSEVFKRCFCIKAIKH